MASCSITTPHDIREFIPDESWSVFLVLGSGTRRGDDALDSLDADLVPGNELSLLPYTFFRAVHPLGSRWAVLSMKATIANPVY